MGNNFPRLGHRKRRQFFRREKWVLQQLSSNNEIHSSVLEKAFPLAVPQPASGDACAVTRLRNLAPATRPLTDSLTVLELGSWCLDLRPPPLPLLPLR